MMPSPTLRPSSHPPAPSPPRPLRPKSLRPRSAPSALRELLKLLALLSGALLFATISLLAGMLLFAETARGDTAPPPATSPRLVTLYQGATDSAVALGLTPIGVVDAWMEKPTYRYLRPALNGVEHVGLETQPNLEKIAWLDPDVIIGTRFRHERVRPLLERIAPTRFAANVYDFRSSLDEVAQATGREAQARELMTCWNARITDLRQRLAQRLGDDWPQKAAVVRFKSDHLRLYSTGFAGSILGEIGFEQPDAASDQGWGIKLTSEENIPTLDADVIFVLLEDDPAILTTYRHWTAHPLWQRLKAAQAGRVYEVNTVNWIMGGGILAANAMLDDLYRHYFPQLASSESAASASRSLPLAADSTPLAVRTSQQAPVGTADCQLAFTSDARAAAKTHSSTRATDDQQDS
ncbi:iron-siderophore ABC transporter substrate-binding protein [Halomonas denitrificans]|uniref:ABC transporter substrate-binding protein n=1 Tax=Halomonas denitrificans TaxID=370769 RepID=UPI001CD6D8C3|nr:iron-siderophore ABC transporter substrate-binding protein [Halomonas denitrificans]MCA0974736.1 iron-siderophore ABC transporter substrate-binding protein [Halomonas denitrificans]